MEFVEDRETKTPFDPKRGIAAIKKHAFEAGLVCYPMSGTIDGARGDHVLLAPPFIIDDAQIDEVVGKLPHGEAPQSRQDFGKTEGSVLCRTVPGLGCAGGPAPTRPARRLPAGGRCGRTAA
jgi:hypothetical protein